MLGELVAMVPQEILIAAPLAIFAAVLFVRLFIEIFWFLKR
jgi:hypothetical protein